MLRNQIGYDPAFTERFLLKPFATAAIGLIVLSSSFAVSAVSAAQPAATRDTRVVVFGKDICPAGQEDEIVVCARKPESDRYRIPKELRERPRDDAGNTAWGSRWDSMEDGTRFTRPNSCSAVGSGGQTGCTQEMIRQWAQERKPRR